MYLVTKSRIIGTPMRYFDPLKNKSQSPDQCLAVAPLSNY